MWSNVWRHEWYSFWHKKTNWLVCLFCLFTAVTGLFGLFYGNRPELAKAQNITRRYMELGEAKGGELSTVCRYYFVNVVADTAALLMLSMLVLLSIGFLADVGRRRVGQELGMGFSRKQLLRVRFLFYFGIMAVLFFGTVLLAFLIKPEIYQGGMEFLTIGFVLKICLYYFSAVVMVESIGLFTGILVRNQWTGMLVFLVLLLCVVQGADQVCSLLAPYPEGVYEMQLYFTPDMEGYREFPAFFLEIRFLAYVVLAVLFYILAEVRMKRTNFK